MFIPSIYGFYGDFGMVDYWVGHIISGWWFGTFGLFFHRLGMSSSQLTNSIIFQRGGEKPPTSLCWLASLMSTYYRLANSWSRWIKMNEIGRLIDQQHMTFTSNATETYDFARYMFGIFSITCGYHWLGLYIISNPLLFTTAIYIFTHNSNNKDNNEQYWQ